MRLIVCTTICLLSLFFVPNLHAQDKPEQDLHAEIKKMDSLLFEVAFNTCDLALYQSILSEELEFYDDRSGLNTSIDKEIASFKDKCSKPFKVTRQLIEDEINRLGDYGAVQTGIHIFLVDDKIVEKAKFITVWERKEDKWLMKRAISYDHRAIE